MEYEGIKKSHLILHTTYYILHTSYLIPQLSLHPSIPPHMAFAHVSFAGFSMSLITLILFELLFAALVRVLVKSLFHSVLMESLWGLRLDGLAEEEQQTTDD